MSVVLQYVDTLAGRFDEMEFVLLFLRGLTGNESNRWKYNGC